jgi:hypothetical protein
MNAKQILEYESRSFQKIQKRLQLPNYFKKFGIALGLFSLLAIFVFRFFIDDADALILVASRILLIALLILAVTKEKVEDELVVKLRSEAFTFAFIAGVVYAIFQPLITMFLSMIIKPEKAYYEDMSVFVILWFMLVVHLCYFYLLKRTR